MKNLAYLANSERTHELGVSEDETGEIGCDQTIYIKGLVYKAKKLGLNYRDTGEWQRCVWETMALDSSDSRVGGAGPGGGKPGIKSQQGLCKDTRMP